MRKGDRYYIKPDCDFVNKLPNFIMLTRFIYKPKPVAYHVNSVDGKEWSEIESISDYSVIRDLYIKINPTQFHYKFQFKQNPLEIID
jgi:hypothetical protein